jgi:hypothetical protein
VKTLLLKLLISAIGHLGVVILLVRLLRREQPASVDMGLVVFIIPTLLALGLYTCVLRPYVVSQLPGAPTALASLSLALIPTMMSFAVSLYIVLNIYGS